MDDILKSKLELVQLSIDHLLDDYLEISKKLVYIEGEKELIYQRGILEGYRQCISEILYEQTQLRVVGEVIDGKN